MFAAYSRCRLSRKKGANRMIYDDELTKRDWYMYRRGEMREYLRHHDILNGEIRHALYQWVDTGHSVHDNPWGIWDETRNKPCDYIKAMSIAYKK